MLHALQVLILVLFLGGCTVSYTSLYVSPVVLLVLLVSATLRARTWPFLLAGFFVGLLLLASSELAFALDRANPQAGRLYPVFLPLAAACLALLGILLGFMTRSPRSKPGGGRVVFKAVVDSLVVCFPVTYLLCGLLLAVASLLAQNARSEALLLLALVYGPAGGFFIPIATAIATRLYLDRRPGAGQGEQAWRRLLHRPVETLWQPGRLPGSLAGTGPEDPLGQAPDAETHPARVTAEDGRLLSLLAAGLSNPEIAARLHISPVHASLWTADLLQKFGLESRTELVGARRRAHSSQNLGRPSN
jgi:DNA-binding CsgD family transcriptional regulator